MSYLKPLKYIITLCSCISFSMLSAQVKIDVAHFIALFNQGKYKQVFDEAYELRNKEEYGKTAILDYFIAKSLCATGNFTAAEKGFQFILSEYPLNKSQKQFMLEEYNQCHKKETMALAGKQFSVIDIKMVNAPNVPIARVSGKAGPILDCKQDTESYRFEPNFNRQELQKRLFDIAEKGKAIAYYKAYLGQRYQADTAGRYIFITQKPYNLSSQEVSQVAKRLEKAYGFFQHYYHLRPPDKLIAVYLLKDKATLRAVAQKVHGMRLPAANIGYSSLDDLSILGNSDATRIGTIYHELFHLMVRTDVGDIPAWLDEGIACLYETSNWKSDTLKGNVINWRTDLLKENTRVKNPFPKIKQLVEENWEGFAVNESATPCKVSLNYALAKHFAIYLQEKNLLQPVVSAFKERQNVFTDTLSNNQSGIQLLEKATGKQIDSLQRDFNHWLAQEYNLNGTVSFRNIEGKMMNVYHNLSIYPNIRDSVSIAELPEYKNLQTEYIAIRQELDRSRRTSNVDQQIVQQSLETTISEELEKRILKYITTGEAFIKAHPVH